ncbi:MAG: hypothetical protein JRI46_10595 [Deltaproteobacteria bacterium]|nr:hypothetical protein [Deltaproteobacteria bacterium]
MKAWLDEEVEMEEDLTLKVHPFVVIFLVIAMKNIHCKVGIKGCCYLAVFSSPTSGGCAP